MTIHHDDDQLLTLAEAADYLRTPIATLRWWRHQGIGPHSFEIGRKVMYWLSDLRGWLETQSAGVNA